MATAPNAAGGAAGVAGLAVGDTVRREVLLDDGEPGAHGRNAESRELQDLVRQNKIAVAVSQNGRESDGGLAHSLNHLFPGEVSGGETNATRQSETLGKPNQVRPLLPGTDNLEAQVRLLGAQVGEGPDGDSHAVAFDERRPDNQDRGIGDPPGREVIDRVRIRNDGDLPGSES